MDDDTDDEENTEEISTDDKAEYLLDGARGQYIPRDFCTGMDLAAFGLSADDPNVLICLKGPPGGCDSVVWTDLQGVKHSGLEDYWDAWDCIMDLAVHTDKEGHTWTLWEDDGLFMVRDDMPEEWFNG